MHFKLHHVTYITILVIKADFALFTNSSFSFLLYRLRPGNRMITADQSEQVYFVDQKRAALRSKLSASLLASLQEVRHANTAAGVTSTSAAENTTTSAAALAGTSGSSIANDTLGSDQPVSTAVLSRSQVLPYMNETLESCAPDTIKSTTRKETQQRPSTISEEEVEQDEMDAFSLHSGSQYTQQSGPKKKQKRHDDASSVNSVKSLAESVTDEVGVEIDITLGRSISYQHGSQAFVLHQLGAKNANSSETKEPQDDVFLDAEAELALEVTTCIEERESAVNALRLEAALLRRAYLNNNDTDLELQQTLNDSMFEGTFDPTTTNNNSAMNSALNTARSGYSSSNNTANLKNSDYYLAKIDNLLARMRDVRRLTMAFADAFGAWARLLHKQKAAKWARDKRKAEQYGASHKKMSRTYAVLIAYRSAKELYPLSQAVHSTVKKFSREMEPVKYATETKLIGVFDTKEEAIGAFDKAFGEIPQEYVLLSDLQAVNKRMIGLRKCGQHYWIRSSGVAQDMACEQCSLQRQLQQEIDKGIPDIYKEEPISQYIWKGQNYLEKMWSDLDFLSEVEYLQKALPDENFQSNPLLLGNESVAALLGTLHRTHKQKNAAAAKAVANRFAITAPDFAASANENIRPKHVLSDLRGKKEQLKDAARAGERQNALIKQQQYDALYKENPYNNTANFGSLTKKAKLSASQTNLAGTEGPARFSTTAPPEDSPFFQFNTSNNNLDTFTASDVHLPPGSSYPAGSSVFYETTLGSVNSEFGQTVAVRELINFPDGSTIEAPNSTPFGTLPNSASPSRANFPHTGDPSLLTAHTMMRTSRSAASHLFPDSSILPHQHPTLSRTAVTVAGNGAVGVKGIKKSASEKAKKNKLEDETTRGSTSKKNEVEATNKNRAGSRGLNTNSYLPDDLRQSSRALPPASLATLPVSHSTTTFSTFESGFPGKLPHASRVTQLAWDTDFLTDADANMDRLARALQLIGQCPVPANDIRSDKFVSETQLAGGITPGPDPFSSTEKSFAEIGNASHNPLALSSSLPNSNRNHNHTSFGSSMPSTIRLPPEPAAKLTQVETFYAYRGAQMSLLQERRAVAHRTEETFCRSDVGEWKGFRKGRAMRAFEFQENLYITGKKKEEARKDMQQLIRTAIAVDIIECDVPYVTELIAKAQKIRGSMLALDIAQAELFLRRYAAVCHLSLRGQSWFRGCRDRKRVKEMRRLIREAKKHYRTTEIEAAKLSITWVGDLLQKCVRTRVQKEKRSVFRFTLNMSGVHCMISMRRQTLPARKPVDGDALCVGCQTQCIVTKFEPADRTYSKNRAPCTCVLREPLEQWQLSIYNPLTRQTFRHVLDVAQVRQMLRGVEWAAKVMRTSTYAQAALQGDSFDHLTPLFNFSPTDTEDYAFSGRRLDRSFSNALLRASEESAVLPGMPLKLPPVISHVMNDSGIHEYHPSEYFRTPFGGSLPVARYDAITMLDGRRGADSFAPHWVWHPLVDITKLKVEIGKHQVLSTSFCDEFQTAAEAERKCMQKQRVVLEQLERVQMVYEDARTVLLHASDAIQVAQDKIEQVMRYCKKLQTDVEKEEKGEKIDDRQSYDQLEDANMWIGLNEKRRLEKLYVVQITDFNARFDEYRRVAAEYRTSCETLLRARDTHQALRRRYDAHLPQMSIRQRMLRELQVATRAAAAAVLSTFSLPRKYPSYATDKAQSDVGTLTGEITAKETDEERVMPLVHHRTSRRLQRLPWNLIFVREPLERLRLSNRSAMTVLQRRIMKLRPQQGTLDKRIKGYLRCIVLVLLDEVTGNIIVHIGGQNESTVEESNQHKDLFLQKSDFSELTSHGLDNEIILRPEDVLWILSIPVELSAANINRANKYAKGRIQGYTLDPNKVSENNPGGDPLVLPSQAVRPLQGVASFPNKSTKLGALLPTYLQRRADKEEKQFAQAGKLLKYLRLQAHTGRPCVGLLHFKRRLAYSHKYIQEASWLSDLVNVDPLMLINHLSSRALMWNDRIVVTHTYNTLRRFQLEVHLPQPAHSSVISTEVSTAHVISRLLPRPLLLANFLWEFVTNSFSPQTMQGVMEGVDWQLPGQLDSSYWRKNFPSEVPRPHFMFHASMQYRGPVYQRHRFVSSKYFLAKLYLSAQDDLLVVLSPPVDGKFFHHQYRGEPLQVHLSRSELYVVVAKVSVQAALVPREMLGTLLLLHPQNLHVLFSILLELLHLSLSNHHHHHHHKEHHEQERHRSHYSHHHNHYHHHHHHHHHGQGHRHQTHDVGEVKHSRSRGRKQSKRTPTKSVEPPVAGHCVLPALSEENAQSFDVAVNLGVLFERTSLLYDKFNHWVQQRHTAFLEGLGDDARWLMRREFLRLAVDPHSSVSSDRQLVPYSILTHKDPSNKQQMRVYHSVWSFLDIGMYYGDPLQPVAAANALKLMNSRKGATFTQLKNLREGRPSNRTGSRKNQANAGTSNSTVKPFPSYTLGSDCFDSLMAVEVLTNISKTTLLVDISPIDLSHADAQGIVSEYEQDLFALEDDHARKLRRFSQVSLAKRRIVLERSALQARLDNGLLPEQETLTRRQHIVTSCIQTMQQQFLAAYEEDQQKRAVFVLNAALGVLLNVETDVNNKLHVHKAAMARALGTVIRVPPHQQRNQLFVDAATWMNETLRHLRKANTAFSPSDVRFFCANSEGKHEPVVSKDAQENHFPGFTSDSVPRHDAKVRDFHAGNAMAQLGSGFRDPDRWYHAKKLNSANHRRRGLASYQAFIDLSTASKQEQPLAVGELWPVGKPTAFVAKEWRGKRLVSTEVLQSVVNKQCNQEPPVLLEEGKQYLIKDSFVYSSGAASIDLYCLQTNKIIHLYAHCESTAAGAAASLFPSVNAHVRERADVCVSLKERVQSALDAEAQKLASITLEIEKTMSSLDSCDRDLFAVTHSKALVAETDAVIDKYLNRADAKMAAAFEGTTFSYHQKDQPTDIIFTASPKTKSSKRRQRTRTSSSDPETETSEKINKKSTTSELPIVAFFVPRDESLAPQLIRSMAHLWHTVVADTLGTSAEANIVAGSDGSTVLNVNRRISPFGLIYFKAHSHQTLNARVHRLFAIMQSQATTTTTVATAVTNLNTKKATKTNQNAVSGEEHAAAIHGDALILLRHGTKDMLTIEKALLAMQQEYAPMKALRALKEGKERQWRLSNHASFRQIVFGLAYPCLNATEDWYGVLKPSLRSLLHETSGEIHPYPAPLPGLQKLPFFQLRLMLSKFNDLQRCLYAVQSHCADNPNTRSWRNFQYFGVLDFCTVCSDDATLLRFDEKCPSGVNFGVFDRRNKYLKEMLTPVSIGSILRDILTPVSELEKEEDGKFYLSDDPQQNGDKQMVITVGQVVYAMYQLHVYNCQLPIPLCKFPGCGRIRAEAAAAATTTMTSLRDPFHPPLSTSPFLGTGAMSEGDDLKRVPGSGLHPIDLATKEFFFTHKETFTKQPPVYLPGHKAPHAAVESVNGKVVVNEEDSSDDEAANSTDAAARLRNEEATDINIADELQQEERLDQAVIATRDTNALLRLDWRALKKESELMYTLHNALVRPEVAQSVTSRELLMAKGGIHALGEEASVKKLITRALVTHSSAANTDYAEYDHSTEAAELLRLVPSATLRAEMAAAEAAELAKRSQKIAQEDEEGAFEEESGGENDSASQSSRSGSSNDSDGSGSEESGNSEEDSEQDDDAFSVSTEGTEVSRVEKLNVQTQVHVKQTHAIPIHILRALSSAALQHLAVRSGFDPYPVHKHADDTDAADVTRHRSNHIHHGHHRHPPLPVEHVNAMPPHMYQLLMQRLRLTRPERIPNLLSSGDGATQLAINPAPTPMLARRASSSMHVTAAGQLPHQSTHYFRFDRLYHEEVVILQDGSVVLMQFMYGILAGASLVVVQPKAKKKNRKLFRNDDIFPNIEIYEAVSGSPPAAIRFLHTSKLPTLKPGLTVAVFDALSSVSRAFIVEERSMQRTCEAFGVLDSDFTALSRQIAAHAHHCVQLTRAGFYCTTVMFSLASLVGERKESAQDIASSEVKVEEDVDCQVVSFELDETAVLTVDDKYLTDQAQAQEEGFPARKDEAEVPSLQPGVADSFGCASAFYAPRYAQSCLGVLNRFSALQALLVNEL